jgi:hypothetical protein
MCNRLRRASFVLPRMGKRPRSAPVFSYARSCRYNLSDIAVSCVRRHRLHPDCGAMRDGEALLSTQVIRGHASLAHNGGRDASYTLGTYHPITYHSTVGTHSNHHRVGAPDPNHTNTGAGQATEPHRLWEGACRSADAGTTDTRTAAKTSKLRILVLLQKSPELEPKTQNTIHDLRF